MEELAKRYAAQPVHFVVVYSREPHAGEGPFANIEQPKTMEHRCSNAQLCREELSINRTMVIDTMDSAVQEAYGGLPNMVFIIDREGKVAYRSSWAKSHRVSEELENLLSAPVTR